MTAPGSQAVPSSLAASAAAPSTDEAERLARLVAVAVSVLWIASLGFRTLVSPDEGRYATISMGMLLSGDWVTPRLNGLLYFEKPPLQYWMGALAMAIFGMNEFAARLWPGLCGLATVWWTGYVALRLWGRRAGWHAWCLAASCGWLIANSHFLSLDAGVSFFLVLALGAVVLAFREGADARERRRWMLVAWAGMAFAVLSKGLIGLVIPGAALFLQTVWSRDLKPWRHLEWWRGPLLFLAITAPWFVLVSMRNPDFARFFFIHEHFERFTSTTHKREGAWWYFLPILALGALPWTSLVPRALSPRGAGFTRRLLIAWCAFVFLFFSASGSKLPSYILPMFPALAWLIAERLESDPPRWHWHLWVPIAFWVALLVAAPIASARESRIPPDAMHTMVFGFSAAAVLFLAGAFVARHAFVRGNASRGLGVLALAHCLAVTVLMSSHEPYGRWKGGVPIRDALAGYLQPDTPMFAVRTYDQTVPFYLRRHVVIVDYRGEFEFGQDRQPELWAPTLADFAKRWQAAPRAAGYVSREWWLAVQRLNLPLKVVDENNDRVVFVKP